MSVFKDWSAYDIVGPLNKSEVRAALLDCDIQKSSFRTWDSIEAMILASPDNVKKIVYDCSLVKRKIEEEHRIVGLKRRREQQKMRRNVRRRLGEIF